MQRARSIVLNLLGIIVGVCSYAQQAFKLEGEWKYSTANNKDLSTTAYNENDWKSREANKLSFIKSDLQGGTTTLWLRTKVHIPASLKSQLKSTGAIAIFLGRIRQTDETFLNGQLVGKSNSSDVQRAYILDTAIIRWDSDNDFLIKINHWGDQSGLQTSMVPYIAAAPAAAIFAYGSTATGLNKKDMIDDRKVDYICHVTNKSIRTLEAGMVVVFSDVYGKELATFPRNLKLKPGMNSVQFPFSSSSSFLSVTYKLLVPEHNYSGTWNDVYGYTNVKYEPATPIVADTITARFVPAALSKQVVGGWLGARLKANMEQRLYRVDEDAILAGFTNKPGAHSWIGEHAGKFIEAAVNTYKNTGDPALKIQLDRTVQRLISAQESDGYLGTYTADNHWTSWDVWSHKYNIIGLLSYYELSGFKPSLEAAKKAGDLLCLTFGTGGGKKDLIKAGAHVGMAASSVLEPMVDLYKFTGNKKYLDFCYYILNTYEQPNGPKIISTLNATGGRVDKTANAKAYEMLTNLVGVLKFYKLTADSNLLKPVQLAWEDIISGKLYITGTASSMEHFKEAGDLPAGNAANMGEGCVTTTWLQLNFQLLSITGEMKYVDELERTVYNHLTGAENPQTGCVSYYTPLMGQKPYGCEITCCMSSVPRGIAMIPQFANGTIEGHPSFFFYQPGKFTSTLQNGKTISFITTTKFPDEGLLNIEIADGSGKFPIIFRQPYWASNFSISVNGTKVDLLTDTIEGKATVFPGRTWKKGDRIVVTFGLPLMIHGGGKSYPQQIAFQRGPQVLVFDQKLNTIDVSKVVVDQKKITLDLVNTNLPGGWIGTKGFIVKPANSNAQAEFILVPYADAGQTGGVITTWLNTKQQ